MALVNCRECDNLVAKTAKKCPHCGVEEPGLSVKQYKTKNTIITVLCIVGIALLFMFKTEVRHAVSRILDYLWG
jgi:hypothetical protein